jgi:hypothetical protein
MHRVCPWLESAAGSTTHPKRRANVIARDSRPPNVPRLEVCAAAP